MLLYVTIKYFCSSSPVTHLKRLEHHFHVHNGTTEQLKPVKRSLFRRFVNHVLSFDPKLIISINAVFFTHDSIKPVLGSECPYTLPGRMILCKASEINTKPSHSSV